MHLRLVGLTAGLMVALAPALPSQGQDAGAKPTLAYPVETAVAANGDLFVVDLDAPGVFAKRGEAPLALFVAGSKRLREPLNRPRCAKVLPSGELLVGDSASRDVYQVAEGGTPKGLTGGKIGIPMSLVVKDDQVYVADLETRFVLKVPLAGGKPEVFAKVNTRGLALDAAGKIWALTQEKAQVVQLNDDGTTTPIVKERKFEFANAIAVTASGAVYVTDSYRKAICRVGPDGNVEDVVAGEPLVYPVGLVAVGDDLLVTDPKAKQVFKLTVADKKLTGVVGQ